MTKIVSLEYARALQRTKNETEKFYALLSGWELECPDEGVLPSDVLELIAALVDVMGFSADFVADYLKLHQGEGSRLVFAEVLASKRAARAKTLSRSFCWVNLVAGGRI